jgi:hypothetical protein
VIRGERPNRDFLQVAMTCDPLALMGCSHGMVVMTPGKLARCRREHPEVTLAEFYQLPNYLADPLAIFPSYRDDGSLVLLLVSESTAGNPIIAALLPGEHKSPNVLLSVYVKDAGIDWIWQQIALAEKEKQQFWMRKDFAATQPQPGSQEVQPPSPSGPIPAGGAAKPSREILTIRKKVKD